MTPKSPVKTPSLKNAKWHTVIALILAIIATFVGWSQSLIYKDTPLIPLALWFPLVIITGAHELVGAGMSLIQFPLFAIAFAFGIRRWPIHHVILVLVLAYALLAGIAVSIVKSHSS
ncbi:MAG: hypothetical protein K0Q55_101 [Verrucomicrobia bacterium]|jgi:hypothetical protein|nr:hypothetical protein [Verrucomicrobiota bacterium]